MTKRKVFQRLVFLLSILVVLSTGGCKKSQRDERAVVDAESGDQSSLHIYLVGVSYSVTFSDGSGIQEYATAIASGLSLTMRPVQYTDGNMIYQALLDFAKENHVELQVEFFGDSRTMFAQLEEDIKNGTVPDLVIDAKTSRMDLKYMLENNWMQDLSPYLEYEEEEYYHRILKSGFKGEEQYIVPFLFNVNGYVTSEEYLQKIGADITAVNSTYEEAIHLFQTACIAESQSTSCTALYESSDVFSYYIAIVLNAGATYHGLEEGTELDISVLEKIYDTMELFYRQEFTNIPNYEENPFRENLGSQNTKYSRIFFGPSIAEDSEYKPARIGILLDGGYGGTIIFSNYVMQAYMMQSYYQDQKQTPVIGAIPLDGTHNQYAANVTGFGFCPGGSTNRKGAARALQYLMDYSFPLELGLSVNKKNVEEILSDLLVTSTKFYVMQDYDPASPMEIQEQNLEARSAVWFKPMEKESVEAIRNILDHIVGATIPSGPVGDEIEDNLTDYLAGTMTREEAIQKTYNTLTEYWRSFY